MSQVAAAQATQYAMKKRKRPQPRNKSSPAPTQVKSNPSKRHRDRLNTELDRLSQLIPLPADVVNKLDKLSILRLSVAYLRNKSYSKHIDIAETIEVSKVTNDFTESDLALQALDGFIMVVTQDFNVFYITSNVQDCLGFPQSDIMYQSMLDLIHAEDRKLFMKQMLINPQGSEPELPPEDGDPPSVPDYVKHGLTPEMVKDLSQDGFLHRSFICRLRCLHDTSSGFLALHFTGHLGLVPGQNRHSENGTPLPPELGLFLLSSPLQTPSILEIRTKNYIFRTKHKLDYTPLGIDQKGRIVLGYTEQELRQQSGYQFIHSADMMHCADSHTKLMRKGQSGLTVFRLLHRANRWQWVTATARLIFNKGQPDYIIATQRPITEQEGEEHLKKRTNAFRFDFTGHATLYASVNPIGAGPAPQNNNQSYGNAPEVKPQVSGHGASSKRPRIANGVRHQEKIDPATLFGAQSLQTMEYYRDGLPIVKSNNSPPNTMYENPNGAVKTERDVLSDIREEDFSVYFKQNTGVPSAGSPHSSYMSLSPEKRIDSMSSQKIGSNSSDSGFSDSDFTHSPMCGSILGSVPENEPPPLHHPPPSVTTANQSLDSYGGQYNSYANTSDTYDSRMPATNSYARPSQQPSSWVSGQATGYHPQVAQQPQHIVNNQNLAMNAQPYNGHDVTVQAYQQDPVQNHQPLPVRNHQPPRPTQPAVAGMQPGQVFSNAQNPHAPVHNHQLGPAQAYRQTSAQSCQPAPVPMHQQAPVPTQPMGPGQLLSNHLVPTGSQGYGQSCFPQQHNKYSQPPNLRQQLPPAIPRDYYATQTTSLPKKNISVLNSLEISSTITKAGEEHHEDLEEILDMLTPANLPNVPNGDFEIQLECQENTIQFDLDKIAAEYQTVNPYDVIQKYVQNNPADALQIARGNMPDNRRNNPNMASIANGINGQPDHFSSCQYENGMLNKNEAGNPGYAPPMMNPQPVNPSKAKTEGQTDGDFNLDDFIEFNIPSI